jgi:uncharacterized protein (TIGR01777 family)
MRLVLAGASGFLGTAWRDHLAREGHEVVRLVRGEAMSASESHWDPYAGQVDRALIESADVVANLAGAPLAHWPWTEAYKRTFLDSRVVTTRTLAEAIAASDRKPAFLAQNGVAGYGDQGDVPLTEESASTADTFMGGVTRAWQDAAGPAADGGARVVVMRTSVILDKRGGALKPLLLAFKAGLGGPIGSGEQYFSTIHARRRSGGVQPLRAAPVHERRVRPGAGPDAAPPLGARDARVADPEGGRRGLVRAAFLHTGRAGPAAGRGVRVPASDAAEPAHRRAGLTSPWAATTPATRQRPSADRVSVTTRVVAWSRGNGTRWPARTATASASRSVTRTRHRSRPRSRTVTASTCIRIPTTRQPRDR